MSWSRKCVLGTSASEHAPLQASTTGGRGLFPAALFFWVLLWGPPAASASALSLEHQQLVQAVEHHDLATPYIVINTQDNLILLRDGEQVLRQAACATGSGRKLEGTKRWHRWTFDTPKGRFAIRRKVADPLWTRPTWFFVENDEEIPIFAEDPRRFQRGVLGTYALYFLKDFMIHGTLFEINLGKSITHGCVRVGNEDLEYLHEAVEIGWPVFIY